MTKKTNKLDIDRIIEMAWEDRTPFDAIYKQHNIDEKQLLKLMRQHLSIQSFKRWRKRVKGRKTKHETSKHSDDNRFVCPTQYKQKNKK